MTSNFFLINYAEIEKMLQEATAALRHRSRFVLEVEIAERLLVGVAHDEACVLFFDGPRRWEAAGRQLTSPA